MKAVNLSQRVFQDALNLSAIGKRRLHIALCRAILSNAPDLDLEKRALHGDVSTADGHVRNQRRQHNGEHHDRNAR